MEREELIEKLVSVQKQLEPGDKRIFDFEAAIVWLKNPDGVAYGHAPNLQARVQRQNFEMGIELLKEFDPNFDDP